MPKTLPSTKPYRVAIAGAIYDSHRETVGPDGEDAIVVVRELALFGQEIELTDREARRLTELEAVKPADEPLSYDEMDDSQLDAAVKDAGIRVQSSGADPDQPLRIDKINALVIYDQGRGRAGQPPAAEPEPPAPPAPGSGEGTSGDGSEDLSKLRRGQLNELAKSLGIEDAEQLPNAGEVVKAIEAKRAETA